MKQGYLQIYTGKGKGKTTASMGVIIRSLAAGYRVYFGQFLKRGEYNEIKSLKKLGGDMITIEQYGYSPTSTRTCTKKRRRRA